MVVLVCSKLTVSSHGPQRTSPARDTLSTAKNPFQKIFHILPLFQVCFQSITCCEYPAKRLLCPFLRICTLHKTHCPLHEKSSEDQHCWQQGEYHFANCEMPSFKVDTFDHFEREHLFIGQLIFCHSNWSFFPSPNICSAALFVQGEEERIQNMDNETFALAKICDVQCLMKSNDLHCQKYVIFDETFKKD